MKVTGATFNRRYSVGQYEYEDYTVTAVLEGKDDVVEVLGELKQNVAEAFVGGKAAADTEEKSSPKSESKKSTKAKAKVEEEEDDIEATEEDEEDIESLEETEDEDDDIEAVEEEEEEEEAPKKSSKKSEVKPKSKLKPKTQTYDRKVEQHKEIFSTVLKGVAPDWKKTTASKDKARVVSTKMHGQEFLDGNGEVLPSFKAEVKKLMAKSNLK